MIELSRMSNSEVIKAYIAIIKNIRYGSDLVIQDPMRYFKSPSKSVIYYLRTQKTGSEQSLALVYVLCLNELH